MVTSGLSPQLEENIGMGYVPPALEKPGTVIELLIREKVRAEITAGPFVPTPNKKIIERRTNRVS